MYQLKLYVAGKTSRILNAVDQLRTYLDTESGINYSLDVIDILEQPESAISAGVYATPTLVRHEPSPSLSIINHLEDGAAIVDKLGLLATAEG